jgi:DNA-binding response OmpR family regulator
MNATTDAKRILLVDDNRMLRAVTATILISSGYVVLPAENAAQALALVQSDGPFDLLITDVNMPGMSGVDLADRLSASDAVKVLFISGNPEQVISFQGLVERGTDFLSKPFSARTLLERVRALLLGSEGPRVTIHWT